MLCFRYFFREIQVDSADVLAIYVAITEVLQRTKEGKSPTLIKNFSYRLKGHSIDDQPFIYHTQGKKYGAKKDPILRFEKYLIKKGDLNLENIKQIKEKTEKDIIFSILKSKKI
ncbi:thiamine pyrophosphate-dependent enzyme [Candidatus Phytoplasma solani]|uniref:2-oxoisovalerate dehydrogenase subunit alpha n=1 Tax=Candidatus Phytoplasma solani TaxID=69896 RepID=A0A421NYV6_9MOLU|nr:thiamine pyrophosphate-dependent enzyme [Candidatus Phytoplasma solani]RMI89189.1 hypothetical protein PSSA1_v1c0690 [Candidatus Phytoplasma solani]RMI89207.1 hypothetical protein PSSA1_v1c0870 [Candidatus Phytoplasma solani]